MAADESFEAKKEYVNFYKNNDTEYYNKGLVFADKAIETFCKYEMNKEEHDYLVTDMVYCLHRFGFSFEEYFWYRLDLKSFKGRNEFISDKVRYYLYNLLNYANNHDKFRNKSEAYKIFGEFYKRDLIEVSGEKDFEQFKNFVNLHDRFIVKPIDGDCGRGTFIINYNDFGSIEDMFNALTIPCVLEELIVQDDELAKFYPQSVNTVRIPVVKSKTGEKVFIFHPFLRTGRGNAVVDNAGAGGVFSDIDADTGLVYTAGIDEHGIEYLKHPDTNEVIIGFQIPKWKEAIDLVERASACTTNRYIGWDLALTKNGWVIVEANDGAQFVSQLADKKGRLREFLELMNQ